MNIKNLLEGEISQDDLLSYYNATIIYNDLPKSIRGFVFFYDNVNFIIIRKSLSYYLRKKTILHEIAHIELNQIGQYDKDLFEFHVNKYEDEADKYIKFILDGIKEEREK